MLPPWPERWGDKRRNERAESESYEHRRAEAGRKTLADPIDQEDAANERGAARQEPHEPKPEARVGGGDAVERGRRITPYR